MGCPRPIVHHISSHLALSPFFMIHSSIVVPARSLRKQSRLRLHWLLTSTPYFPVREAQDMRHSAPAWRSLATSPTQMQTQFGWSYPEGSKSARGWVTIERNQESFSEEADYECKQGIRINISRLFNCKCYRIHIFMNGNGKTALPMNSVIWYKWES